MPKIEITHNVRDRKFEFFGEYTEEEMVGMILTDFDHAVLEQKIRCGADMLLNLELMFRKMEEGKIK